MELIYRGISYFYNTSQIQAKTSSISCKYRGLTYQQPENPQVYAPTVATLKYRGVSYSASTLEADRGSSRVAKQVLVFS